MLGIDITRSPHPRALLIFSPLLSGGLFVIGYAYFRPELIERFSAYQHLDSALRIAMLLVVSYATGMILTAAVVFPFMVFIYTFGYGAMLFLISRTRSRMELSTQPSSRPAFRRSASVVLGSTIVPQTPESNADALVEKLVAFFGTAGKNQTSELGRTSSPEQTQLKLDALKIFGPDFDEQWSDIHKGLFQLQMKSQSSGDTAIVFEPTLAVAAAIVVWRWLSFPIPAVLLWAAILTFVYFGAALLFVGIQSAIQYMDGSSVQSFLFERFLDQRKDAKSEK